MTPEQIARGLTEAQREALIGATFSLFDNAVVLLPCGSRAKLIKVGLVSPTPSRTLSGGKSRSHRLTPLGLAVRAELERINHD